MSGVFCYLAVRKLETSVFNFLILTGNIQYQSPPPPHELLKLKPSQRCGGGDTSQAAELFKKVGVFKWLRHFIYSADIFIQHLSCSVTAGQAAKTQAVSVPKKLPFLQLKSETSSSVCPKTDPLSDFTLNLL